VKKINSANRILWINFLTSLAFGTLLFTIPVYAQDLDISFTSLGRIGAIGSLVYTVSTIVSGILLRARIDDIWINGWIDNPNDTEPHCARDIIK
jgi:MFS family permease